MSSSIDLPWSWDRARSKKQKRFDMVKKRPQSRPKTMHTRRLSSSSVRRRFVFCYGDGSCTKEEILRTAQLALSSYNERNLDEQGIEYELVEPLTCIYLPRRGGSVFHCNFVARPKNQIEAEDKLFFAELCYGKYENDGKALPLNCHLCCILGPRGTQTGLYGCKNCEKHPGLLQHPQDGFRVT